MSQNKEFNFLRSIGEKICVETNGIKKAQEYYRLCCVKSNLDKINDIPKGIICLDLATKTLGLPFDKPAALKYSSMLPAKYNKCYNLIEQTLELQRNLSISELCVKLNCSEVKELAETILCKYKETNIIHDDLSHPQYNAVVIYTACKLKGVKVTKRQFIQESHLNQMQWKQLENKFIGFVKSAGLDTDGANKKSESHLTFNDVQTADTSKAATSHKQFSEEIEDYETWKARILKEAREALQLEGYPLETS